jgi:hypothetical protein
MAADLAELKRQLPVLVQLLQIRGLIPVTTANESEQDNPREKEPFSDRPCGLANSPSPHKPTPAPEPESQPQDQGDQGEENGEEGGL